MLLVLIISVLATGIGRLQNLVQSVMFWGRASYKSEWLSSMDFTFHSFLLALFPQLLMIHVALSSLRSFKIYWKYTSGE